MPWEESVGWASALRVKAFGVRARQSLVPASSLHMSAIAPRRDAAAAQREVGKDQGPGAGATAVLDAVMMGLSGDEEEGDTSKPGPPRLALAPGTLLAPWQVYALILAAPAAGIGLILANKMLMNEMNFRFSGLLVALHFASNATVLTLLSWAGAFAHKAMPTYDRLLLGSMGALSIVLGTTSLKINSLGAFLATNMLTTPSTVLLRFLWEGKRYDLPVLGALSVVVAGVALHTINDKDLQAGWGLPVAFVSVICNAAYQVLQKMRQDSLGVNSAQLLQQISPVVAAGGAVVASFEAAGEGGFLAIHWSPLLVSALALTAVMAVTSNVAAGALIGVTSPVTFQVMGYVKACLLFLASLAWSYAMGGVESMPAWGSMVGVPLSLLGAVLYGRWVRG